MAEKLANVALSEVGPFRFDDASQTADFRVCDFCFESACDDLWAGKTDEADWRRFYELLGEGGTVCCENCLPALLAGEHEFV